MKRDIIKEIEMKRVRYNHNESFPLIQQLKDYENMMKNNPEKNIYDYQPYHSIPVTICSAFESFFRSAVREIVDLNFMDIKRVMLIKEIKSFRFDFLSINEIKTKEISLGELISQLVRIKKLRSINTIFSILLNTNFLTSLKSFNHLTKASWIIEVEEYWARNYNEILRDINSAYELRNITCHEFGFCIDIKKETLFRYLKNSIAFLEHVDFYLYSLHHPAPKKIRKIKEVTRAKKSFLEKEKQLNELIARVLKALNSFEFDMEPSEEAFTSEIILWKQHRKKVAKSNCEMYIGTRNYYTMYWHEMMWITGEKIDVLLRRNESLFSEAERYSQIQKFI